MNIFRLLLGFVLLSGPIAQINARPKASDTLKRAELLPDGNSKPPTISNEEGDVVLVGMSFLQTERGHRAPVPTPGKPIYYVAYDGGLRSTVAGVNPPPAAALGRALRGALVLAGYEPATNEHRPSLAIVYRLEYGTSGMTPLSRNGVATTLDDFNGRESTPTSICSVAVFAYDYEDLTRSTQTLLWGTRARTGGEYPISNDQIKFRQERLLVRSPEETFLGFVTACAPYLGAQVPAEAPMKTEPIWAAIPHPNDLSDPTAAFPALSPPALVLDQRALRKMERVEMESEERARDKMRAKGWGRGGSAREAAESTSNRFKVEISPALAGRIASYLGEKNALQKSLAARTQGVAAGASPESVIDAFAAEHAREITSLTLTGEAIRRTIVRWEIPTVPDELANKPLDALLREFEPQIRASTNLERETKHE